ncbi:hypothetical protein [Pseudoclavibacter sp. VKM Ac-2867]|uniref:hypothetical protein n=1 Tax=Pseudoclavibacter sp. VKM Ac-2867 TaxID=2783829 RepID=UPI00188D22B2|nr:hypothetical protein [Pseudoclavibacter sp. VKM Ac-2867]MBF4459384.1 hypothetical protein [Pseudoclavibacter sp. VKM Ac-2867]
MPEQVVATREFETDAGILRLEVIPKGGDAPAFKYRILNSNGDEIESLEVYGADSVQALLFCLTAAGDYLQRYVPSASFFETGVSGLPITDIGAVGEWRARISIPTE